MLGRTQWKFNQICDKMGWGKPITTLEPCHCFMRLPPETAERGRGEEDGSGKLDRKGEVDDSLSPSTLLLAQDGTITNLLNLE